MTTTLRTLPTTNVSTSSSNDASSGNGAASGSEPCPAQRAGGNGETDSVTITRKSNETVACVSPVPHVVEPDQPIESTQLDIPPLKRHHGENSSAGSAANASSDCESVSSSGTQNLTSRQAKRPKHSSVSLSVSFCEPLVTEVLFRPKTLPEDKTLLHYTFDEMDSFREEYYIFCQEQMVLDELAASSADDLDNDEPSEHCEKAASDSHLIDDDLEDPTDFPALADTPAVSKHAISKVMVVHKSDNATDDSAEDSDNSGNTSDGSADEENPMVYTASNDDDYFFDNSAFWNGNLTWC